ncbi:hypothetical protein CSV80_05765 [Sporosarcina sp. P12(2017)]|uniref:hypothetical protein n=1 Tax=unclassified Sporosarcina TaxID=2647733 RepID=UPI000C170542|nr:MULTISPECIES: hypothetical protein [unclassified Sporosarcina]PIC58309.1 hypothetical protein CSV81_03965 [Sporosarcina sp. P10]PIC61526.1 hypothetical protein CSV80_05765 [Sporosarcina sp. P12(2017)]
MRLLTAPGKTTWTFLSALQEFLFEPISRLKKDFTRTLRKSKGRQKVPIKSDKQRNFGEDHAVVSPINRQHFVDREKEKKKKAQEQRMKDK